MLLDQETLKKILKKHHEEQARDEKGRFACKILGLGTIPKPFAIEGLPEDYK